MRERLTTALNYVILAILLTIFVVIVFFRQEAYDEYRLRNYVPTAQVQSYVERSGMSELGERMFFTGHPQVNQPDEFNRNCQFSELSIVLGCYTTPDIFILDIEEPQLEGIEDVTAAHEMLHIVYERLEGDEKTDVHGMLARQLEQITDQRILDTLQTYSQTETYNGAPAYNEMHSIFPTEVRELTPEMETYFRQYFDNRQKVVGLSESYEQVFTDLQDRIDGLNAKIETLAIQINQQESELSSKRTALNAQTSELNSLRNSGDVSAYNAAVPVYNAAVDDFNSTLNAYRSSIQSHNEFVREVNSIVLEKRSLQTSINSKFSEASTPTN